MNDPQSVPRTRAAGVLCLLAAATLALECPPPILDPTPGFSVNARLEPGKTNRFRLRLDAGETLTAAVEEPGLGEFHDPVIAILPPGATEPSAVVDDGGPGFLPRFSLLVPESGIWELVVTGRDDDARDGSHRESFAYRMVVTATEDPQLEADDLANDDASGAESIALLPGTSARVIAGSLTPGDVDHYEVEMPTGRVLSGALFDGVAGEFNDSLLALGSATNDDAGPGFLSNLRVETDPAGSDRVLVRITGFDPDADDGRPHGEDFAYRLVLSTSLPW